MKEPRFIIDIPGPPGHWTFVSDRYCLGWGYSRGRFCWNCFRKRRIVFIQDRNKTGLCQPCACLLREARKRRDRHRLPKASGPSNKQKGEETARQIMELLRGNGKMTSAQIADALGMSRTAISLHLRGGLAPLVRRSRGEDNSAIWELVA